MTLEIFLNPHLDCSTITTFEAQKGSKDIIIVHVTTVVNP